jgi:hypothetical protein
MRAILHPLNDQPLVVEILEMPTAVDIALVCRNVRTLDGKKPKFIDRKDSTFIFPYDSIRFLEIYSTGEGGVEEPDGAEAAEPEELEIDEDFLRRVREA